MNIPCKKINNKTGQKFIKTYPELNCDFEGDFLELKAFFLVQFWTKHDYLQQ